MGVADPSGDRSAFLSRPRLGEVDGGRENNLNLIRVILASLVILSHCYVLLGRFPDEPMQRWLRFGDLGGTAVLSFFFLSGFLIFKSATRSSLERFMLARVLRIFPALAVVSLLCMLILGPAVTIRPIDRYFADPGTWRYLGNALLHTEHVTLPGVFGDRPDRIVNQPLWTLPAEWAMYVAMWAICISLAIRQKSAFTPTRLLLIALMIAFTLTLPSLPWRYAIQWFAMAGLGAAAYLARRAISLSIPIAVLAAILCGTALLLAPLLGKVIFFPTIAYLLLVIGFHPALCWRGYHRVGDYSYGLYVYAWPIQQLMMYRTLTPLALFVAAYPAALAVGILSWHFVEQPCLRIKALIRHRAGSFAGPVFPLRSGETA